MQGRPGLYCPRSTVNQTAHVALKILRTVTAYGLLQKNGGPDTSITRVGLRDESVPRRDYRLPGSLTTSCAATPAWSEGHSPVLVLAWGSVPNRAMFCAVIGPCVKMRSIL